MRTVLPLAEARCTHRLLPTTRWVGVLADFLKLCVAEALLAVEVRKLCKKLRASSFLHAQKAGLKPASACQKSYP